MAQKYDPTEFKRTQKHVINFLRKFGWSVEEYGSETLSERLQRLLTNVYDPTTLYVRSRPDLVATQGFQAWYERRTWLIECKDWLQQVAETGNYSAEALPFFTARHLAKLRVNYCYAIDDPDYGLVFFKPTYPPFIRLQRISVTNRSESLFKKHVEAALKQVFPSLGLSFRYGSRVRDEASGDAYLLIPKESLAEATRAYDFARTGRLP